MKHQKNNSKLRVYAEFDRDEVAAVAYLLNSKLTDKEWLNLCAEPIKIQFDQLAKSDLMDRSDAKAFQLALIMLSIANASN